MAGERSIPLRPKRPSMNSAMRNSSFLKEHQQYRPPSKTENGPTNVPFAFDTVVKASPTPSPPAQFVPFHGIPSVDYPPRIVESGVRHELSHPDCVPQPGHRTKRLIATLFYKSKAPRISNAIPSPRLASPALAPASTTAPEKDAASAAAAPAASASVSALLGDIPPTMAPSTSLDDFPLEPPAAEPEPLDHLYGSHVSAMCITSFLHLMSTGFPMPSGAASGGDEAQALTSAHRCLALEPAPAHGDHSGRREHRPVVVELTLSPAPSPTYLSLADLRRHELIYRFEREWNVDVALQPDTLWRRYPRLVVFDMDSTLITQEVIDLLALRVDSDMPDLGARIAAITHRAMLGELDFEASFRERVALLKGLRESAFTDLRAELRVTKGVRPLLRALRRLGVRTAVLSGGFRPLTEWLAAELGIDHAHANDVEIDPATRRLTGRVRSRIVGAERKRELLVEIAAQEKIPLGQVVAVGDGANDLCMMQAAGLLGVAWNAKPWVQMEADARLNGDSLLDLLYLFGFTAEEVELLAAEG